MRSIASVKFLLGILLVVILIAGAMKLAGQQLPFIDYRLGPLPWGPQHIDLVPGGLQNQGGGGQITIPLH